MQQPTEELYIQALYAATKLHQQSYFGNEQQKNWLDQYRRCNYVTNMI